MSGREPGEHPSDYYPDTGELVHTSTVMLASAPSSHPILETIDFNLVQLMPLFEDRILIPQLHVGEFSFLGEVTEWGYTDLELLAFNAVIRDNTLRITINGQDHPFIIFHFNPSDGANPTFRADIYNMSDAMELFNLLDVHTPYSSIPVTSDGLGHADALSEASYLSGEYPDSFE